MVTDNELLQGWGMSAAFHASMVGIFDKGTIPYLATQAFYGLVYSKLLTILNIMAYCVRKRKWSI